MSRAPARVSAAATAAVGVAPSRLRMSRPGDRSEADADRAAAQAMSAGGAARRASLAEAPAGWASAGWAPAGFESRVAAARAEAGSLPGEERGFFEGRFGHDFGRVRVHAGPAAAAAAAAAGAQAFTLGQDIFFGAGRYRPDNRDLLAHELAHTVQDRPGVVARRVLDTGADPGLPDADARPGTDAAARDLAGVIGAVPAQNDAAQSTLDGLDPEARLEAVAQTRARLPAGEGGRVASLARPGPGAPELPEPASSMPALRAADTPPATVQRKPDQPPEPAHVQASAAAASRMQQAVAAVAAGPEPGEADAPGVAGAGPAGPAGPPAREGRANAAAQGAVARLGALLAELGAARSQPVQFADEDGGPPGDPVAFARVQQSRSLAAGFVGRAADRIGAVLAAGLAVPGQAMAALAAARAGVGAQEAAQGAALKDGADATRKRVQAQAARVRGAIDGAHAAADRAAAADVGAARDKAERAHGQADGGLGKRADTEKARIRRSYVAAEAPMAAVGLTAGGLARGAAERRSDTLLGQRNGESSVLDGPLHDNRLEANAEAGVKVGAEYNKSFQASAVEQAGHVPDSQPEVLAKIDEITGQAHGGLAAQLEQIRQGMGALGKGAVAQSRGAGAQMRAALAGAAAQSTGALDTAEGQQRAALAGQSAAAQAALDDAVAAALAGLADGLSEAGGGLVGSLSEFIASAAAMPAPERDELAAALSGADPESALAGMAAQVRTFAPGLAGILGDAREAGEGALQSAAAVAKQGFEQSTTAFVATAGGIGRQSATGFRALGAGTKRSAVEAGATAEGGFKEAETNASAAYAQFGDQVESNFRTGRDQLLAGLWSRENQGKLDDTMRRTGEEAASHVQPRWKKVLKWVVTIVVIVAVIAITIASAGALGPVGVVLLGAALGAAAGAVQTIANNLIDGEPWSKGVVKAMIVGAIGGAVGGAGGVLLKGVGSVALRITLEFGVNVVGGVAAEAIGAAATGGTFDFTSALMGALIGAGVGAGLGIAGALKGRIRIGGIGEPAAPRVAVEPPPVAPPGRIRSALESALILKPRPGVAVPEVGVGVVGEGPAAGPRPRRPIGFGRENEPLEVSGAEPAAPRPRRPAGFGRENEPVEVAGAEPAAPRPRRPVGFGRENEPLEVPGAEPAAPRPRRPIGFGRENEPLEVAGAEPVAPRPRRPIGFGRENEPVEVPGAEPAAPRPPRPIGFGRENAAVEAPAAEPQAPRIPRRIGFGADRLPALDNALPGSGLPAATPPRAMLVEPPMPRPLPGGAIRAGGRSPLAIRASGEPAGGGGAAQPRVVEPPVVRTSAPAGGEAVPEPARAPAPDPAPGAGEPPPARAKPDELAGQGVRPKPGERSMTREQWRQQSGRERWRKNVERELGENFDKERVAADDVRGGRIGDRRVPGEPPRRMDLEDIPRRAGETRRQAARRIERVMGRKLSDFPELDRAWNDARARITRRTPLTSENYAELYDRVRGAFWRRVRGDSRAVALLTDAGFDPPAPGGRAPRLAGLDPAIPKEEGLISLDHLQEKAQGDNWRKALDADNLQMEFARPNSNREIVQMRHPDLRPAP